MADDIQLIYNFYEYSKFFTLLRSYCKYNQVHLFKLYYYIKTILAKILQIIVCNFLSYSIMMIKDPQKSLRNSCVLLFSCITELS